MSVPLKVSALKTLFTKSLGNGESVPPLVPRITVAHRETSTSVSFCVCACVSMSVSLSPFIGKTQCGLLGNEFLNHTRDEYGPQVERQVGT